MKTIITWKVKMAIEPQSHLLPNLFLLLIFLTPLSIGAHFKSSKTFVTIGLNILEVK